MSKVIHKTMKILWDFS